MFIACRDGITALWYYGLKLMVSNLELCNYSDSRWGCMILDALLVARHLASFISVIS